MGYSADFTGYLKLSRPATQDEIKYINLFSGTRRMKRDVDVLKALYNGEHGFNGEYGTEGEYFAKEDGNSGQSRDTSIIEYNWPPATQPGLWCQWVLTENGRKLEWDGGEKFYNYIQWLEYIITNFFKPLGIKLNGKFRWKGENRGDTGTIQVTDNIIVIS